MYLKKIKYFRKALLEIPTALQAEAELFSFPDAMSFFTRRTFSNISGNTQESTTIKLLFPSVSLGIMFTPNKQLYLTQIQFYHKTVFQVNCKLYQIKG